LFERSIVVLLWTYWRIIVSAIVKLDEHAAATVLRDVIGTVVYCRSDVTRDLAAYWIGVIYDYPCSLSLILPRPPAGAPTSLYPVHHDRLSVSCSSSTTATAIYVQ